MAEPPVKQTARTMLEMLERHYAPPPSKPAGGRLISEIQAPNSLRRADALYLPITTGGRGTIIGHEIKVSRSDVITELRDPHKADSWLRYCSRWWLVVADPAHLDGLDVPPEWGVLAPPLRASTRFMQVIVKAPVLTPDPVLMRAAWGTVFAKVAYVDIAEMNQLQRWMTDARDKGRMLEEARAEIRRLNVALGVEGGTGRRMRTTKVADILAEVERLGGYGDGVPKGWQGVSWSVEPSTVARMILAATVGNESMEQLTKEVEAQLARADATAVKLRATLTEMRASDKAPEG